MHVRADSCQVALLFKTVCSQFCFLLSPGWSCWLSQAAAAPFFDLVDQPLIPCLATSKFQTREAGQAVGVGPACEGLEILGELRFTSLKNNFSQFLFRFCHLGKGRGISQREEGWSWNHQEQK